MSELARVDKDTDYIVLSNGFRFSCRMNSSSLAQYINAAHAESVKPLVDALQEIVGETKPAHFDESIGEWFKCHTCDKLEQIAKKTLESFR